MSLFPEAEGIPSHVPADRVYDYDMYHGRAPDGDFAHFMLKLRGDGVPDIFWTPKNGGHWVVTRGPDVDLVLNDAGHFSSRHIRVPKYSNASPPLVPLQVDPPDHRKYRELIMPAMSPKAVGALGEAARALAIEMIDEIFEKGSCDFVPQFGHKLPIAVFMAMVDLPLSDRPHLLEIADRVQRPETPEERIKASAGLKAYIRAKIEERRAEPGEDLISRLVHGEVDGEQMSDDTLVGMLLLVLLAGLDTVTSMLSNFARFLAESPSHRRQLIADPSLIPAAVEELLRRFAIVTVGREIVQDIEIGGVTMKAGDMIIAPTPLSNLNEDKYADPLEVDFKRKSLAHATFGGGAHRCLGSMLARTELRIFLEEWLKRIPDYRVKPGAIVEATTDVTSVIRSLELEWDVEALRQAA